MPKAPFENVLRFLFRASAQGAASQWSDRQLLDRFAARGEETAFDLLIQRHGRMVYAVACRTLGNSDDAEDVFQATFLVLARRIRQIGGTQSVGGWLHGVAQHLAWKARTKAVTRRRHERQAQTMKKTQDDRHDLSCEELRALLDTEIGALAEKYRAPVVL